MTFLILIELNGMNSCLKKNKIAHRCLEKLKILGIEGAKVDIIIPEKISKDAKVLHGILKITSLSNTIP